MIFVIVFSLHRHQTDFHVPFLTQLFIRDDDVQSEDVRPAAGLTDDIEVVYATDCVMWHRRGEVRGPDDELNCPRMTASGKGIGPKKQYKTPTVSNKDKVAAKDKTPKTVKVAKEKVPKVVKAKRAARPTAPRKKACSAIEVSVVCENLDVNEQLEGAAGEALTGDDHISQPQRLMEGHGQMMENSDAEDNRYVGDGEDNESLYFQDISSDSSAAGEQIRWSKTTKRRGKRGDSDSDSDSDSEGNHSGDESEDGGWGEGGGRASESDVDDDVELGSGKCPSYKQYA